MQPKSRPASTSTGCGCGCGGADCGCAKTRPQCPESSFRRPRFFAGQLLTEDDLEQITAYQNAKRRLTNRDLFGAGVVCGLEVKARVRPERPGDLIVSPGHALDCCGNDIVLPCPYTFNLHDMIKDQKLACPTPCPGKGDDQLRDYFLYIRYDEQDAELVRPYAPDGNASCENSRVEETCTFELRCPPSEAHAPGGLLGQVGECLKDAITDSEADELRQLQKFLGRWDKVKGQKDFKVNLKNDEATTLAGMHDALERLDLVAPDPGARDAADQARKKLAEAREPLRQAIRVFARILFAGSDTWTALVAAIGAGATLEGLKEDLGKAKTAFNDVKPKLADLNKLVPGSEPPHPWSDAFIDVIGDWLTIDATTGLKPEQRNRLVDQLFVTDDFDDAEPYTPTRYRATLQTFNRHRRRALEDLGGETATASPGVLKFVGRVPELPLPRRDAPDFSRENLDRVATLLAGVPALDEAVGRTQKECFCAALNPPCPLCEDLGVLLACVTACGCEIVKICNLVRTIVISPAALQYWLPVQLVLEALCCEPDDEQARTRDRLSGQLKPLLQAAERLLGLERASTAPGPGGTTPT
jgi:hypothetical protein